MNKSKRNHPVFHIMSCQVSIITDFSAFLLNSTDWFAPEFYDLLPPIIVPAGHIAVKCCHPHSLGPSPTSGPGLDQAHICLLYLLASPEGPRCFQLDMFFSCKERPGDNICNILNDLVMSVL